MPQPVSAVAGRQASWHTKLWYPHLRTIWPIAHTLSVVCSDGCWRTSGSCSSLSVPLPKGCHFNAWGRARGGWRNGGYLNATLAVEVPENASCARQWTLHHVPSQCLSLAGTLPVMPAIACSGTVSTSSGPIMACNVRSSAAVSGVLPCARRKFASDKRWLPGVHNTVATASRPRARAASPEARVAQSTPSEVAKQASKSKPREHAARSRCCRAYSTSHTEYGRPSGS